MPVMDRVLVVRPDFEVATYLGSLALQHIVDYIRLRGLTLEDLRGDNAVRDKVLESLSRLDPIWCILLGHGNATTYTGQNFDRIFWECNSSELRDRVVYALSCITAARLGPDAVDKGCRTYIGYSEEFIWTQEAPVDPLADRYGRSFFEPVLELLYRLADGATTGEAFKASIDKWNYWIDYWSRSTDPAAPAILMYLIHDRDCQKLIGDDFATVTTPIPIPWWPMTMIIGFAPIGIVLGFIGGSEIAKAVAKK